MTTTSSTAGSSRGSWAGSCEQGVKRDDDTKLMCPYLLPLSSQTRNSLSLSLSLSCHNTIPCHAMCVVHCMTMTMTMTMLVGKLQDTPQQQIILLNWNAFSISCLLRGGSLELGTVVVFRGGGGGGTPWSWSWSWWGSQWSINGKGLTIWVSEWLF